MGFCLVSSRKRERVVERGREKRDRERHDSNMTYSNVTLNDK